MESPTLIANRARGSGRFGSKRFMSMFFPRSAQQTAPANVQRDGDESVIYPEEAFQTGITFEAKLVGVMDIPRPRSRMEIVAAMRRVRYDHKTKGIGKRKVELRISTEGVKVATSQSGQARLGFGRVEYDKLDNHIAFETDANTILHHPIYRIFYVSHDSLDLNVFSYIVRENQSDFLRCIVFKAKKKADAMQIVKTIGQAFDVCHQLQQKAACKNIVDPSTNSPRKSKSQSKSPTLADCACPEGPNSTSELIDQTGSYAGDPITALRIRKSVSEMAPHNRAAYAHRLPGSLTASQLPESPNGLVHSYDAYGRLATSSSEGSSEEAVRKHAAAAVSVSTVRLEHELQKSRVAKSQISFLKSQLASETAARIDAQNRIDELLRQNAMLLDVIENLLAPAGTAPNADSNVDDMKSLQNMETTKDYPFAQSLPFNKIAISSNSSNSSRELPNQAPVTSSPDSGVKCSAAYYLDDEESY